MRFLLVLLMIASCRTPTRLDRELRGLSTSTVAAELGQEIEW